MSAYSNLILGTSGLVAYWRLGESSGTATDLVSGYTGTNTSVVFSQPGAIAGDADTAYGFNGTSSISVMPNGALIQIGVGSLECWFKQTAPQASYRGIVVKELAYGIFVIDNVLGFYDWGGGTERTSGVNPSDGAWHHAVLVFDSGVVNGTKLYLDGADIWTTQVTMSSQANQLCVGSGSSGGQLFGGDVDEVAVYTTKLSAATIAAHYNGGLGIFPSGAQHSNRHAEGQRKTSRVIYMGSGR